MTRDERAALRAAAEAARVGVPMADDPMPWARLLVAAHPAAVLALLGALDAAEAERDRMREALEEISNFAEAFTTPNRERAQIAARARAALAAPGGEGGGA